MSSLSWFYEKNSFHSIFSVLLSDFRYSKIKIGFDVTCLLTTAFMTGYFLRHIDGLGIGTIVAAFTMGKGISIAGNIIDRHMTFKSFMSVNEQPA